jgi:hypothetical protein
MKEKNNKKIRKERIRQKSKTEKGGRGWIEGCCGSLGIKTVRAVLLNNVIVSGMWLILHRILGYVSLRMCHLISLLVY